MSNELTRAATEAERNIERRIQWRMKYHRCGRDWAIEYGRMLEETARLEAGLRELGFDFFDRSSK